MYNINSATLDSFPFLHNLQANILLSNKRKIVWCLAINFTGIPSKKKIKEEDLEYKGDSVREDLFQKFKKNYTVEELGKILRDEKQFFFKKQLDEKLRLAMVHGDLTKLRNELNQLLKDIKDKNFLTKEIFKRFSFLKRQLLNSQNLPDKERKKELIIFKRKLRGILDQPTLDKLKSKVVKLFSEIKDGNQLVGIILEKKLKYFTDHELKNMTEKQIINQILELTKQRGFAFEKLWKKELFKEINTEIFNARSESIRKWISQLAEKGFSSDRTDVKVTSSRSQLNYELKIKREQNNNEKDNNGKNKNQDDPILLSFFLTKNGFNKLRLEDSKIPYDEAFLRGSNNPETRKILGDQKLPEKERKKWSSKVDAMILLANNTIDDLKVAKTIIEKSLDGVGRILFIEKGKKLENKKHKKENREHFGFKDGQSQPKFLGYMERKEENNHDDPTDFITTDNFHENLCLVAVDESDKFNFLDEEKIENLLDKDKDKGKKSKIMLGSYFVFRKLEQNKALFEEMKVKNLQNVEKIIGRTIKEGHPLTPLNRLSTNDFDYQYDPNGDDCPFSAHIRKTNPRTIIEANTNEIEENNKRYSLNKPGDPALYENPDTKKIMIDSEKKRIVRRGITYDDRKNQDNLNPSKDVGLLFMCYQASIKYQFEYIIQKWCNDPNFLKPNSGVDALIGQPADFPELIIHKGMEYLYAPSIHFLKQLPKYNYSVKNTQFQYGIG